MYRALALKAIERDASLDDRNHAGKDRRWFLRIRLEPTIGGNRTLIDGRDVSARIRERDVTEAACARPRSILRCASGWWIINGQWARAGAW